MADGKYYWLRLKRDFFKRHDIMVVESMPNGKDYILFYLKLLCESVDHDGNLRFSERIPYSEEMLATITNTNPDVVRSAVKVFTQLGMMEKLDDGTLFMTEVQSMIGTESKWAEKKRLQRSEGQKRDNVPQLSPNCPTTVPQLSGHCPIETEKETEIESESDLDTESDLEIESKTMAFSNEKARRSATPYQQIIDAWNSIGHGITEIQRIGEGTKRRASVAARVKEYGLDKVLEAIAIIPRCPFLLGNGSKGWVIDFDWFTRPNNFIKVLEGNYLNGQQARSKQARELQDSYSLFEEWATEDQHG